MPRVRPPRSDAGQVHLLGTAVKTATGDSAQNRSYLPAGLLTQISAFLGDSQQNGTTLPGHATLLARRAALEGKVTQETADALTAEDILDTHIRDYIIVLARRTFRMKHSAAVLDFHQIDHAGTVPTISSREDRRTFARQLIAGDPAAIQAGFPPMANPSAVELDAALQTATREAEEIIPADRELQAILELIRASRPRATELAQEVIDELRHATRKLEPGTARDIMRSYGITFETLEGEAPEPGDVPVQPATPPAPAPGA
jgi:hypothetical protein